MSDAPTLLTIDATRLKELERLAEAGEYSAHLLHDITNPLTAALLHLKDPPNDIHAARRSITLMHRYVETARQRLSTTNKKVTFAVAPLLEELTEVFRVIAAENDVTLKLTTGRDYFLNGSPLKFQRIASNVIINAVESYAGQQLHSTQRDVTIDLRSASVDRVELVVSDQGCGIPPDQASKIFEAFYTTKQNQRVPGLGLGLATVKKYTEDYFGGSIALSSNPGGGTSIRISFPVTTQKQEHN